MSANPVIYDSDEILEELEDRTVKPARDANGREVPAEPVDDEPADGEAFEPEVLEEPLTDEEPEEETADDEEPTALPSQSERDNCATEVSTRPSVRERRAPGRFLDFVTSFGSNTAAKPFVGSAETDVVPVTAFALSAEAFVENLPTTVDGLMKRSDWGCWKEAINSELQSLQQNRTWDLVPKPAGKNLVECKWVFRIKRDEAGNVDKYKARLVAKGYSQRKGFDYEETFAPVAKITTVRVLLAVANQKQYHIHQMDVKTGFLNGLLKEEIYMRQPEGFEEGDPNLVCRLRKSLYGLKQAPRSWNSEFNNYVLSLNFKKSNLDSCLYWKRVGDMVIYLLLYVDDILLVANRLDLVKEIKAKLSSKFEMTDMGEMKHFLGLKVERNQSEGTMKISQPKYVMDLLKRFGMEDCRPVSTPLESNLKIETDSSSGTKQPYRELIGCLIYLSVASRPDISAAVNYFSQFQAAPTDVHWNHLKRILRYLKKTTNYGLVFRRTEKGEPLRGYADADWGNCSTDRRSISGCVFQVFGGTVSWMTRKQNAVALSSTEAEYISLSQAMCEGIWIRGLLEELNINMKDAVPMYEDNQSCIRVAEESRNHKRMKHVDIRYNFIREKIQDGLFKVHYVPTTDQTADIFTKGLPRGPFEYLRNKLGLCD